MILVFQFWGPDWIYGSPESTDFENRKTMAGWKFQHFRKGIIYKAWRFANKAMFESCFFPRTHRVFWSSTSLSTWSAPCTRRAARRGGVDEWMVAANKIRGWTVEPSPELASKQQNWWWKVRKRGVVTCCDCCCPNLGALILNIWTCQICGSMGAELLNLDYNVASSSWSICSKKRHLIYQLRFTHQLVP